MHTKTLETLTQFSTLCRTLPGTLQAITAEIEQCENAIMDIEHYIELNRLDRTTACRMSRMIKSQRKRRRECKDALAILKPLASYIDKHKAVWGDLDRVRGEVKKKIQEITGPRLYRPRVLVGLFEGKEAGSDE